jgi:membrane protein DedA with SNARE-associated domain
MLSHTTLFHGQSALALSVFLLTFAYEDGATLLAVTLGVAGRLDPRLGFASASLGIWAGDMGLYLLGEKIGGKVGRCGWPTRLVSPASLAKAQSWFARRGMVAIILSRFIPGSRLPLYFAAGALKQPAKIFGSVTGVCALVWVGAIFAVSHFTLLARLSFGRSFAALAVGLFVSPWLLAKLIRSLSPKVRLIWSRFHRWEFWPAWMFYPPVAAICAWLALKYRGLALLTVANPSFRNGGIIGESKIDILQALMTAAPDYVADGYLLPAAPLSLRLDEFRRVCQKHAISYPLVLKPNLGQRGSGFKLISSPWEAEKYLAQVTADVIVQRYISHEKEIGVFYYRIPGQQHGEIFAVTEKLFPTLIGDGASTFEQLLQKDKRASLIASTYLSRFPQLRHEVLRSGDRVRLVEAGNHCQGCIFRDGSHLASEVLRNLVDDISRQIPGFFIGRYDIRYANDEDLEAGLFKIIELNGAASEATNIYDERNSLVSAYRTLYKQWDLVFRIGRANRDRGDRPASVLNVLRDAKLYAAISQRYPTPD